jgi:hypothetical protein
MLAQRASTSSRPTTRPVCIDQIFVHSYNDERRLFITASRVDTTEAFDEILEYPILSVIPSSPLSSGVLGFVRGLSMSFLSP